MIEDTLFEVVRDSDVKGFVLAAEYVNVSHSFVEVKVTSILHKPIQFSTI